MSAKLDLFSVLQKFNTHDVEFFDSLSDEQNKHIHPFVIQRWLTGTNNELQISLINEHSNMVVFETSHSHRLLSWYVLLACTLRGKQQYKWIKQSTKLSSGKTLSMRVLSETYNYSQSQSLDAIQLLTVDDLYEMAEDLGWQTAELAALRKEHNPHKPS